MRKLTGILVALLMVGLLTLPLFASDISGAVYQGDISVKNTGTAATNVCVPFTLSTENLIAGSMMDFDCLNSSIQINGADVAYMPAPSGRTDWSVFVPTINQNDTRIATLYTGGADMNSKIRYFPGLGGMTTIDDDADLELGNTFSIEQKGFINTASGSNKNLVLKTGAIQVDDSTASTITATITANVFIPSYTLVPDGDVTLNITNSTGANHYGQVNSNNPATYVSETAAFDHTDIYSLQDHSILYSPTITSMTVYANISFNIPIATSANYYIGLELSGNTTWGAAHTYSDSVGSDVIFNALSRPGGGSWTIADLNALQLMIRINTTGTINYARVYYTYVSIATTRTYSPTVSITPVPPAEYTLKTYADGSYLMLSLNGNTSWDGIHSARTPLALVTVTNTGNNWAFLENDSMPYMEYQKITIGGALAQWIHWQNNDAVFVDSGEFGNDATPTFRTTSSDADVSAELVSFNPMATSDVHGYSVTGDPTMFDELPDEIPNMYNEGSTAGIPGADTINTILTDSGTPIEVLWYPVAFGLAIAAGFGVYKLTKQLIIQAIASGVVMAVFCGGGLLGTGLLPWWTVVVFILEALAVVILQSSKEVQW